MLVACWGNGDRRPARSRREAKVTEPAPPPVEAPSPTSPAEAPPRTAGDGGPHLVLFVVLDTVRADHTSLCGYDRPTTPFLQGLVREHGWSHTCGLVTPGTWTLPSHASFFTGEPPTRHELLTKGYPLRDGVPTLAETFAARGYQTVLLSANPTLNRVSGIGRGFQTFVTSPGLYAKGWRGKDLGDHVDALLDDIDPERPLFLFVNIFDAHDPYPAVPSGVDWLERQPGMDVNPNNPKSVEVMDFVLGRMEGGARDRFLSRLRDTYDYGVSEADRSLRRLAGTLRERGLMRRHVRVVVTSDHGENLGEHDLVRHDGPPWEPVVRVPLLVFDTAAGPITLPPTLSGLAVHTLVADGKLPAPLPEPASYAVAHTTPNRMRQDSVALWEDGSTKWLWVNERPWRVDLTTDPAEAALIDARALPGGARLATEHAALLATKARIRSRGTDPAMLEALRAVGYLDEEVPEAAAP